MSKSADRAAIVNTICSVAQQVKQTLISYSYLYIFEGRAIEVVYRAKDFLHLTGVETTLCAEDFFRLAVKGKLTPKQIGFSQRHSYDTCKKKMSMFHKLPSVADAELLMLENVTTDHIVFDYGVSDLTFTIGLSGDYDSTTGNRRGDYYIARSFRVEDSFNRAADGYEVHFILMKKNNEKLYHTIKYAENGKNLNTLPPEILSKIDASLYTNDSTQ